MEPDVDMIGHHVGDQITYHSQDTLICLAHRDEHADTYKFIEEVLNVQSVVEGIYSIDIRCLIRQDINYTIIVNEPRNKVSIHKIAIV